MHKQDNKKILAAVDDLFFSVKIGDTAKRAGMSVEFVKSDKDLLDKAKEKPTLIIVDLNFAAVQPIKVIGKLKANTETKPISLIGFLSHIQAELKQKAIEAGCNMVLAKSAFSSNLPQILKRHGGVF
ncbi:MAG: response regulator [Bryobacterales bacterium]|nr:response regulator [Bryobacterales bacterium]